MIFPPIVHRQHQKIQEHLGKTGTILSFSRIYNAPKNIKDRVPYYVAIIELEKTQERMTLQICKESEENVAIRKKVILVSRKHSNNKEKLIMYKLKGKVLDQSF